MFGAPYFYGKEVEGPLSDIDTCFIRTDTPRDMQKYPHVYFCISYISSVKNFNEIESCLDRYQIVTLEVTPDLIKTIPATIFNRCRIMLSLDCPELELLKKNDVVKIVTKPFTTYNVVKCTMQTSIPDDYKFDSKNPTI